MKKTIFIFATAFMLFLLGSGQGQAMEQAQEMQVQIQELSAQAELLKPLVELVSSGKELGNLAMLSALLIFLIGLLKHPKSGGWLSSISKAKRVMIIVCLGHVLGVVTALMQGQPLLSALMTGMIVTGGAISTHAMVIRPFTKKKRLS